MNLNEIRRIINDNSFERLKDTDLFNEVNRTHSLFYSIQRSNPGMLATDVFAVDYDDMLSEVDDLFTRVRKVYLPTDTAYKQMAEVWTYLT